MLTDEEVVAELQSWASLLEKETAEAEAKDKAGDSQGQWGKGYAYGKFAALDLWSKVMSSLAHRKKFDHTNTEEFDAWRQEGVAKWTEQQEYIDKLREEEHAATGS